MIHRGAQRSARGWRLAIVVAIASCCRIAFEPIDDAPLTLDNGAAIVCGPAYQPVSGLTTRYRMGNAAVSWYVAEQDCESDGGHLPVVEDDDENSWLNSQGAGWLGLSDHMTEGTFLWVTGATPTYTNWSLSEPNNLVGYEDCAGQYLAADWNDYNCSIHTLPFMCECDERPLPSPAVWCVTGQDTSCSTCADTCAGNQTCDGSETCI